MIAESSSSILETGSEFSTRDRNSLHGIGILFGTWWSWDPLFRVEVSAPLGSSSESEGTSILFWTWSWRHSNPILNVAVTTFEFSCERGRNRFVLCTSDSGDQINVWCWFLRFPLWETIVPATFSLRPSIERCDVCDGNIQSLSWRYRNSPQVFSRRYRNPLRNVELVVLLESSLLQNSEVTVLDPPFCMVSCVSLPAFI